MRMRTISVIYAMARCVGKLLDVRLRMDIVAGLGTRFSEVSSRADSTFGPLGRSGRSGAKL